jgi:DNA-binding IclR family transcriptional regulator
MSGGSNHQARTVISKISLILLAIADGSRTLTEIAVRTELPLSTVHRLTTDLAAWGVLDRAHDGRYRVGPPLRTVVCEGTSSIDDPVDPPLTLRDLAVPVMDDLFRAVGVRVRVGFLDEVLDVTYVQKESLHHPVSRECAAARLPVHATALGKALLAFSPQSLVRTVLRRQLRKYTPFTIVRPDLLLATFRAIRATRLAVGDRELDPESCAVAAPVFGAGGEVVAAIEIDVRDLAHDVPVWRPTLAVAAGSLSRALGRLSGAPPVAAPHRLGRSPTPQSQPARLVITGS